jgi:membrane protease YdiL (CAAX protease family)
MPEPGKLGAWSAIAAYAALLFGMLVIGAPAQQHGIVMGLWVTEALAIALPAVFVLSLAGIRPAPYLGFRPLSWKQGLIAAGAALANQPVVSFLTWAAHAALPRALVEDFDAKQRMLDSVFRVQAIPMLVTVTLAAPLGEEVFFRGFALPALRKSLGPLAAILISAALFALLHMDPVGFVGLMEIGVLLAALRWWSGSIWAAIVAHALNNGVAGTAFRLGWEDPDVPPPPQVLALGATLFLVGVAALWRVLRDAPDLDAEEIPGGPRRSIVMVLALVWAGAVVWGARLLLTIRGAI